MKHDHEKSQEELIDQLRATQQALLDLAREQETKGSTNDHSRNEFQRHLFSILGHSLDAVVLISKSGVVLNANQQAARFFGGPIESLLGKHFLDLGVISAKDVPHMLANFASLLIGRARTLDVEVTGIDGVRRHMETSSSLVRWDGKLLGLLCFIRDASERKEAERLEREASLRLAEILTSISDGFFSLDQALCVTYFNSAAERILGRSRGDVLGKPLFDSFPEARGSVFEEKYRYALKHKEVVNFETYFDAPSLRNWYQVRVYPMLEGIAVYFRAITEEKLAATRLAQEKEKLAITLQSIGDGVIATDISGCVMILNAVASHMTGWSQEEAAGRPLREVLQIIHEQTRAPYTDPVTDVLRSGHSVKLAHAAVLIARDGSEYSISHSGTPIRAANGDMNGVVLVFRDTTEEVRLNQALQRAQRIESLGMLAAGVAHDFNNMLSGVFGNVELALEGLLQSDVQLVEKSLKRVLAASERARGLTNQLLTFSVGGVPLRQVVDLSPLLRSGTEFALSGSNISCEFAISEGLWPSACDANQISQVLNNLVINAREAMPDGGTIRIIAENVSLDENKHFPESSQREFVRIAVCDSGVGISPSNLSKIFDPFFSTKEKGHGIGLATVFSIIRRHEGWIDVDSSPGRGSTFFVYLPARKTGEVLLTERKKSGKPLGGRVLVIDDEEALRELLKDYLNLLGCDVALAKNGDTAIQLFSDHEASCKPFRFCIIDLTIPGEVGGVEIAAALLRLRSNAVLIATSGYSDSPVAADPLKYGFAAFLAKPFDRADLEKALECISRE